MDSLSFNEHAENSKHNKTDTNNLECLESGNAIPLASETCFIKEEHFEFEEDDKKNILDCMETDTRSYELDPLTVCSIKEEPVPDELSTEPGGPIPIEAETCFLKEEHINIHDGSVQSKTQITSEHIRKFVDVRSIVFGDTLNNGIKSEDGSDFSSSDEFDFGALNQSASCNYSSQDVNDNFPNSYELSTSAVKESSKTPGQPNRKARRRPGTTPFTPELAPSDPVSTQPNSSQPTNYQSDRSPRSPWATVYPPELEQDISSKFKVNNVGPHVSSSKDPLHYFSIFFNNSLWNLLISSTNNYARKEIKNCKKDCHLESWTDVTVEEMKCFIAILINMGLSKRSGIERYWHTGFSQVTPFYSKVMTFKRFKLIYSMFHVSSHVSPTSIGQPGYDRWAKVRDFVNLMTNSFKESFIPGQKIYIRESLIGKNKYHTFIHSKPDKRHIQYGIKKFYLCDSATCYVVNVVLYSGKDFLAGRKEPFTHKVVEYLLRDASLLRKGYHLFSNSYSNTESLAHWLLKENTYFTGTVNKIDKELSQNITSGEQVLYFRKEVQPRSSVLLAQYNKGTVSRPVNFVTTAYHAEDLKVVSSSGKPRTKPSFVDKFKYNMGIINDESKFHVTCSRTTGQYWKKIVFNFIDTALLNAFVLYTMHNRTGMRRVDFIISVVEALCQGQPALGPTADLKSSCTRKEMSKSTERVCVVCSEDGITNTSSTWWCTKCYDAFHPKCLINLDHGQESGPRTRKRTRHE